MKAVISVAHPDVVKLFVILTALNDELTRLLATFLHGERDPIASPEKELIWSIRNEYCPEHWRDRLEEMRVNVYLSLCRRSHVVNFRPGDIGENQTEAMAVLSTFHFVMKRKKGKWVNEIHIDHHPRELPFANAVKLIAEKLHENDEAESD